MGYNSARKERMSWRKLPFAIWTTKFWPHIGGGRRRGGCSLGEALRDVIVDSAADFRRGAADSPEELVEESRRIRAMQLRPLRDSNAAVVRQSRRERDAQIDAALRGKRQSPAGK